MFGFFVYSGVSSRQRSVKQMQFLSEYPPGKRSSSLSNVLNIYFMKSFKNVTKFAYEHEKNLKFRGIAQIRCQFDAFF